MPDPSQPTIPTVPPPTTEVSIRTLASDLAAVRASGGAIIAPTGSTVGVLGDRMHPVAAGNSSHLLSSILGWLAVFLALIALLGVGWLGYGYLTRLSTTTTPTVTPTSTTTAPPRTAPRNSLASLSATVTAHQSQLQKTVPFSTTFVAIPAPNTLQTRFQLIREGLNKIPASTRVAELVPTDTTSRPLSFPGYATALGADTLFDAEEYARYFNDDFSLLAIRGQGGFSAVYVFSLKPNMTWLYAEPGVRVMEQSTVLNNLFFQVPGARSAFTDATIQDFPVRTATYTEPAGTFVYGFFRDRLIIATSQQALEETLLFFCLEPGSC